MVQKLVTFWKVGQKYVESFEMRRWRRMEISCVIPYIYVSVTLTLVKFPIYMLVFHFSVAPYIYV